MEKGGSETGKLEAEEKGEEMEQREGGIGKKNDIGRVKLLAGKSRERAGSMPDIGKWIKRKRDEEEKGGEEGNEDEDDLLLAFKKSNIVARSPVKKGGEGEGEESNKGVEGEESARLILKEIRELRREERQNKKEVLNKLGG